MKPEQPANGILKRNDWGDTKVYEVVCTCHESDHNHRVWVEADNTGEVSVVVYTKTTTTFWKSGRWVQIWKLLTRGCIDFEAAIILDEQQALNYSATLKQAVKDVKQLQKQN